MNHDLTTALNRLADQIKDQEDQLQKTEEATKTSIVLPFLQALGYNPFDLNEVVPEFHADVGTKKQDKVDYAIMRDGKPEMIIECKCYGSNLDNSHVDQLFRYFTATDARLAILTNGMDYHVHAAFDEVNKMDLSPFFKFKLTREDLLNAAMVSRIEKLHKDHYNYPRLANMGIRLKAENLVYEWLNQQRTDPSDDFIKFVLKEIPIKEKKVTSSLTKEYKPIIQKTLQKFSEDKTTSTLQNLYASQAEQDNELEDLPSKVQTTEEELEAYYIIKGLIRKTVPADSISFKDTQSYFAIFLNQMISKTVCRLYLNSTKTKYILIKISEEKDKWERYEITTLDDLYGLEESLRKAVEGVFMS